MNTNAMKKRIRLIVCLLTLISFLLSFAISCRGIDPKGYTKFTVREGLASFSFEYPSFFLRPFIGQSQEPRYTGVTSSGLTTMPERGIEFLSIYVRSPSDSFPDSLTKLDYDLKNIETLSDFKLLERSPINVSGSRGELVAFSYYGLKILHELGSQGIGTSYRAYFDHGGLIWEIVIIADEEGTKAAKIHIEHIIQTFKILGINTFNR